MATKKVSKWVTVSDEKVMHVWECGDKTCRGKKVNVSPDWYADNGTPVCFECESDMIYVKTLILK